MREWRTLGSVPKGAEPNVVMLQCVCHRLFLRAKTLNS